MTKKDLDWVIEVKGEEIPPEDTKSWSLSDGEKESSFTVVIHNRDMKYSGKFSIDDDLTARFGYVGKLGSKITLTVLEIGETFPTGGAFLTVVGKDKTSKLKGDRGSGNYDEKSPKSVGTTVTKEATGVDATAKKVNDPKVLDEDGTPMIKKIMNINENHEEFLEKVMRVLHPEKQKGNAGTPVIPKSGKDASSYKGDREKGFSFSGTGRDDDHAKGENQAGQAGADPVTGTLKLLGYPDLKSKTNITMKGYGPDASGTYYVKLAMHSWSPGSGYLTSASLTRGGKGEGGSGTESKLSEVILTSDIYDGGKMTIGPRDHDSASVATFTKDTDDFIIEFDFKIAPQENTGGAKGKGSGAGHDLTERARPTTVTPEATGTQGKPDPKAKQETGGTRDVG